MDPTRLDRLVVRGLQAACRLMWGFPPLRIPFVVERMGAPRAVVIAHLVRMVGTMNGIATENDVACDEAQSPINKDVALKARYTTLRAGVA